MSMKPDFLQLNIDILKQGNRYVAYSPALDISTSGKSEEEVRKRFAENVEIFFEELNEAGTLKEVLYELGWKKVSKKWQPPQVSNASINVDPPVTV